MAAFTSPRSIRVRGELSPELIHVVDSAIVHVDFSLIEGARSLERQKEMYETGRSHFDGVIYRSRHQISEKDPLAHAVDFLPVPLPGNNWENRPLFTHYAGFFLGIGWELGIELIWGGDWDGDFQWTDQSFHDLPHLEEKR